MTVTIHDERGALTSLAPRWRELLARDPAATIFQTPEYASVWWEEFGALRSLALIEVASPAGDPAGDPAGIVPLSMEPDGVVHFVGDPAIADYLAPVSGPDDREAVAAALVESAVGLTGFTGLSLSGLPDGSGWPDTIAQAAKEAGLGVTQEPEDVCPVAVIGGSYDGYLASLTGKQRHEIRRKERRLSDAGDFSVRLAEPATLEADMDDFFAMHRSSSGPKGKFMHQNMAAYFRRLATTMLHAGLLRMAILDLGGTPVAGLFGFSYAGTWSIYNSAYDHARRDLSPGMVLVAQTVRMAAEEGCERYDFLRGAEEYKYRFGAVDRSVIRVTAAPAE